MAQVLPYPWSLLALSGDKGGSLSLEHCEQAEALNGESLTFFGVADEQALGIRHAVCLAEGVKFNPKTQAGSVQGTLSMPSWPHDSSSQWRFHAGKFDYIIPIHGTLRRASAWEDLTEHNKAEVSLREAIDLLSRYFNEAIALTREKDSSEFSDFAGRTIVRLDWAAIWERWKKVSTPGQPRMARVVEIAQDHLVCIRDVCERPRRMLVRQREQVPVGRVQELDSTCLRDLIQRPGRTVLEKAGARQQIVAVTRRETVDTAENRVIRDFIGLCQHRASAYVRENSSAPNHPRVKVVADLRSNCERLEKGSAISGASRLVGIPRPNYVLQKDHRYHPLWVQYEKLRKEETAVDDIWKWGRRLWAEFVRGVVVSFLTSAEGRSSGWQPDGELTAYLRGEHQAGGFTPALSVSSRWMRQDGQTRLYLVHPAHAHLCPGVEELLPRMGADLALAIYPGGNEPQRPKALLGIYSVLSLQTDKTQRDAMAISLNSCLDRVAQQNPELNVRGLLLRGEWAGDRPSEKPRLGRLDYLAEPAGGPYWFSEFPELLKVLLEELAA